MTKDSASRIESPFNPQDRWDRLQNLYVIRDKDRNLRKLRFNEGQCEMAEIARRNLQAWTPIRHMDLKARQVGATTFWALYVLDDTLFTPNTVSFIVAQKQDTLNLIWSIIRLAYENMPEGLRPKAREDSARGLSFDGLNSAIKVSLKVESSTLHNLHVSEYALCDPDDIEKTIAAVPKAANVILETVPNGYNHARDKWFAKTDGYTRIFHPWYKSKEYASDVPLDSPETQEEVALRMIAKNRDVDLTWKQVSWRRQKKGDMPRLFKEQFAEDETSCFLASGGAYFDGEKISKLIVEAKAANLEKPPKIGKDYIQWEEPTMAHRYVAAADVMNEGGGPDPDWHVLSIICLTCRKTAFRYRSRALLDSFSDVCFDWCTKYNRALFAPEENAHGKTLIVDHRKRYSNLYARNRKETRAIGAPKADLKYGWATDRHSKPLMLDQLKVGLEGDWRDGPDDFRPEIIWLDEEFLAETLNVVEKDGKIGAVAGKHDDMVMAYAIAMQLYYGSRPLAGGAVRRIVLGEKMESADTFKD